MTRAPTRTHFHRSRLIRTLADLAVLESTEPTAALAEKLGQWIEFTDAIALSGVHQAAAAVPPGTRSGAPGGAGLSLHDVFTRTRAALEHTIKTSGSPKPNGPRTELSLPKLEVALDDAAAYAPFRRYHQAHQRDMEAKVRALRAKLREGVAQASPQLQQLAALDATFDGILRGREARLLARIPFLLEKRFNQLRQAHLQARPGAPPSEDQPEQWMKPGAWLACFCAELSAVLLAELDLRLQPALGLLEALHNENTRQHV